MAWSPFFRRVPYGRVALKIVRRGRLSIYRTAYFGRRGRLSRQDYRLGRRTVVQAVLDGPDGKLCAGTESQPIEDVRHVDARGAFGYDQSLGNLPVRPSLGDEQGHLALPRTERGRRH